MIPYYLAPVVQVICNPYTRPYNHSHACRSQRWVSGRSELYELCVVCARAFLAPLLTQWPRGVRHAEDDRVPAPQHSLIANLENLQIASCLVSRFSYEIKCVHGNQVLDSRVGDRCLEHAHAVAARELMRVIDDALRIAVEVADPHTDHLHSVHVRVRVAERLSYTTATSQWLRGGNWQLLQTHRTLWKWYSRHVVWSGASCGGMCSGRLGGNRQAHRRG